MDIQITEESDKLYEISPIERPIICLPPEEIDSPPFLDVLQVVNSS